MKITESRLKEIILEECVRMMREQKEEEAPKASHEISAAASSLLSAIETFTSEDLPEVPTELSTALKAAKLILTNMSDNPGRYRGVNTTAQDASTEPLK
jgi:hypothetical protein